jgi:hypothetical protein
MAVNTESTMMLDWNEYRKQLAGGVKEIGQLSPDTIRGYVELSQPDRRRTCSAQGHAN